MIRGQQVHLRPIEERDLPILRRWQDDARIMTGWAMPQPIVPHNAFSDDLTNRFAHFETAGYFIIETVEGPIGRIDFHGFDERHRAPEIGIYIGERDAQGKGNARDAISTLARYLFEQRRAARVELTVIESNMRARRLYEAIGFVTEGVLRDWIYFDGAFHNEVLMALYSTEMIS